MKAITLHQPWASLIALGTKTIETRSWKPPAALIGQRLLIHAAARKVPYVSFGSERGMWHVAPQGWGEYGDKSPVLWRDETPPGALFARQRRVPLPVGAIVASCVLTDAVPMVDDYGTHPCGPAARGDEPIKRCALVIEPGVFGRLMLTTNMGSLNMSDQRPYGDFAPGRWAWLLEDVKPTTERCPACWGEGGAWETIEGLEWGWDCDLCLGAKVCDPIPAKGKQGLWNWEPADG